MRILAVTSGDYGERHVSNIKEYKPDSWSITTWQAPTVYPLVIDYPDEFLPPSLPESDLILSFGEHRAIAELIPEISIMTGAKSVIASVDNEAWLPRGLARQLRGWLENISAVCVTPKPLCSLTDTDYLESRHMRVKYQDSRISEFSKYFGQPDIVLGIDPETKRITSSTVKRDAVCGCARYVSKGLVGISVDEAEEKSGLQHHHFPCLASMVKDSDFGDTLMHVSGNLMKENISKQVKPFKQTSYISPGKRSD